MFRINSLIVLLLLVVSLDAQQHIPNKKAFKLFEQGRTSFDGMNYESAIYLFDQAILKDPLYCCLLYTSPSPRDRTRSRMPSSA